MLNTATEQDSRLWGLPAIESTYQVEILSHSGTTKPDIALSDGNLFYFDEAETVTLAEWIKHFKSKRIAYIYTKLTKKQAKYGKSLTQYALFINQAYDDCCYKFA